MYWGSVRFFKHLIIGTMILIFILLSSLIFNVLQAGAVFSSAAIMDPSSFEDESHFEDLFDNNKMEHREEKTDSEALASPIDDKIPQTAYFDSNKPYQLLYPELYCNKPNEVTAQDKTVYLTFDDGPSPLTLEILKLLKENHVKATFFVVGKTDDASRKIMKQIIDEGHTIGVHSYSHEYKMVYSSIGAYLDDFYHTYCLIYEATGIKPDIFRFPGGSVNSYNKKVYTDIIEEMNRRGFTYYDWNVSSVDTVSNATARSIYNNIMDNVFIPSRSIVLFHDSERKRPTVDALDGIIKDIKAHGYALDGLTNKIKPIVFKY